MKPSNWMATAVLSLAIAGCGRSVSPYAAAIEGTYVQEDRPSRLLHIHGDRWRQDESLFADCSFTAMKTGRDTYEVELTFRKPQVPGRTTLVVHTDAEGIRVKGKDGLPPETRFRRKAQR
jgi:hypothetical protein